MPITFFLFYVVNIIPTPGDLLQLGFAGLMFIVWYATFKKANESFVLVTTNSNETITSLAEKTSKSYEKAIEDGQKRNDQLIELIRANAKEEAEIKSHIIRILTRMEEKMDQPLRCPANIQTRLGGNE